MTQRGRDVDDEPTREGLEHLQSAAKELIAAARSFLDAAEHLVEDPGVVRDAVATVTSLAALAGRAVMGAGAGAAREDAGAASRVEHISVD